MAKPTEVELVIVTWNDAWTESDQPVSIEDALLNHAPMVVKTIGWIICENDKGIQIANEKYEDSYRGVTFITRAMIVDVQPYKLSKKRGTHADRPASDH